jgi:hypothetical protein
MLEQLVENLVHTKQIFAKTYEGNAHIQEIIPTKISEKFHLDSEYFQSIYKIFIILHSKIPSTLIIMKKRLMEFHVLYMKATLTIIG